MVEIAIALKSVLKEGMKLSMMLNQDSLKAMLSRHRLFRLWLKIFLLENYSQFRVFWPGYILFSLFIRSQPETLSMNRVKSSKCTSEALTTGCQSKRIGDQEAAEHIANGETTFPNIEELTFSFFTKCQQVLIIMTFLKQLWS